MTCLTLLPRGGVMAACSRSKSGGEYVWVNPSKEVGWLVGWLVGYYGSGNIPIAPIEKSSDVSFYLTMPRKDNFVRFYKKNVYQM